MKRPLEREAVVLEGNMPTTFSTGYVAGNATGTFVAFPYSGNADIYLRPHPENRGTAFIISNPGAIGYPIPSGSAPLVLENVEDVSSLRGWFEVLNDKICYLIVDR